jgi:DNA replication protein DnaC
MAERTRKRALTSYDLERANLPRRYWNVRFSEIPDTAPYKGQVARYLRDIVGEVEKGRGLMITHPMNGTGKTGIACLIAKRAMIEGFTVYYTMSETYKTAVVRNQMFDDVQSVYERAREVDVLVIDDFGKEYKGESGWIESELENLIRERVQAGRTTLLTANLLPNQLRTEYTKDLASVLNEAVYVLLVPGSLEGGKDWRDERKLGALTEDPRPESKTPDNDGWD